MRRLHRTRGVIALLSAALLVGGLSACAPDVSVDPGATIAIDTPLPDDVQAQLESAVERAIAGSGATGAVVGVWVPWAGTWLAGSGSTQPDGSAVKAGTTFTAGTITRAMTCDVLYGMAADGMVKLDDPVTDYVPGLPGRENVTLEDLCDSTSGLASYTPPITARLTANPARDWAPRELVAYGTARTGDTVPGSTFADSDTGYVLLGVALEHASRKTAAQLYEQYVFEPLGMTSTSLPAKATAELHGLVSPNAAAGGVDCSVLIDMSDLSPSAGFTASGVVTDLTDLGRYTQSLATGTRSYDSGSRFADPLPAAADAPSWFTARGGAYQAGSLIGQYGSTPGFLTAAFADSNTGMTVVVALNNYRAPSSLVRSLAWQLAAIASKAPAASGETAPEAGLPWTADDMGAQVTSAAICPIP